MESHALTIPLHVRVPIQFTPRLAYEFNVDDDDTNLP